MNTLTTHLAIAAISTLASMPNASAASVASASITGVAITLADLDPSDGITPGVVFTSIATQAYTSAATGGTDPFNISFGRNRSNFAALSAVAPIPLGYDSSSSGSFAGGQAGSLRADAYSNIDGLANAAVKVEYTFKLTPRTAMRIAGTILGYAGSGGEPVGQYFQYASSDSHIVFTSDIAGAVNVNFPLSFHISPVAGTFAFNDRSESLAFSYTYLNNAGTVANAQVYALVNSLVQNSALPVPVPEANTGLAMSAGVIALLLLKSCDSRRGGRKVLPNPSTRISQRVNKTVR